MFLGLGHANPSTQTVELTARIRLQYTAKETSNTTAISTAS